MDRSLCLPAFMYFNVALLHSGVDQLIPCLAVFAQMAQLLQQSGKIYVHTSSDWKYSTHYTLSIIHTVYHVCSSSYHILQSVILVVQLHERKQHLLFLCPLSISCCYCHPSALSRKYNFLKDSELLVLLLP